MGGLRGRRLHLEVARIPREADAWRLPVEQTNEPWSTLRAPRRASFAILQPTGSDATDTTKKKCTTLHLVLDESLAPPPRKVPLALLDQQEARSSNH
jgi:hypothetical protein